MEGGGSQCGPRACSVVPVHVEINASTRCMGEESKLLKAFNQAVKGRKIAKSMQQHIKIIECEIGPPCLEKHQIAFGGNQMLGVEQARVQGDGGGGGGRGGGGAEGAWRIALFQPGLLPGQPLHVILSFQGRNSMIPFLGALETTCLSSFREPVSCLHSGILSCGVQGERLLWKVGGKL